MINLRVLDVAISISSSDQELVGFLSELWEPFRIGDNAREAAAIVVEKEGPGWTVSVEDRPAQYVAEPWGLALDLRVIIDELVRASNPGLVDLHAAAVKIDDATVLFPGDSGAGKTTIVLEGLHHADWTLLGDDLAFLDPRSDRLIPLARPIGIRTGVPLSDFSGRWCPPPWLPEPVGIPYAVPASAFGVVRQPEPVSPKVIVFPRYRRNQPTRLDALTGAQTLARLSRHADPLTASSMTALSRLAQGVRGAWLSYQSPADGVALIHSFVGAEG